MEKEDRSLSKDVVSHHANVLIHSDEKKDTQFWGENRVGGVGDQIERKRR